MYRRHSIKDVFVRVGDIPSHRYTVEQVNQALQYYSDFGARIIPGKEEEVLNILDDAPGGVDIDEYLETHGLMEILDPFIKDIAMPKKYHFSPGETVYYSFDEEQRPAEVVTTSYLHKNEENPNLNQMMVDVRWEGGYIPENLGSYSPDPERIQLPVGTISKESNYLFG